jgi:3-deoxy-manno-octulosonate cytidylyltransferase (CMP-KDO synthetase)
MTSDRCLTGTDRVSEAWSYLSKTKRYKYILNCQGDEPTLDPKIIIDTIEYMKKNPGYSVNCYASTNDEDKVESTNIIKMITDRDNFLIYASRSLIPGRKKRLSKQNETYKKQVAVYGFTTKDLKLFGPEKEKTAIEEIEDIEILRILEHGSNVLMKEVKNFKTAAVDVKEDIANVERILRKN